MIFAYVNVNYMQNPPVALGHKDHMATTRSVACDPTMSQGRWAKWACCSKDGVRNNQKDQKDQNGSCGLCPLPSLSLHVQLQIEAQTFRPGQPGPVLSLQCQAPAFDGPQHGDFSPNCNQSTMFCHFFSGALGMMISGSMTCPPAFAPDDARPGRV